MLRSMLVSIVYVLFFGLFTLSHATIINVPDDQPTIQGGIDAAVDADTVLVQPGTYVENINYNGKNIILGSLFLTTQDTSYISQTVIDGNQNGSVVTFESGEDSTAVLCGVTVTNGNGTVIGSGNYSFGGGIYCTESSPIIRECHIQNNSTFDGEPWGSHDSGGGIYCSESDAQLSNNVIRDNQSELSGGGLSVNNSNLTVLNNIIVNNIASKGAGIICVDATFNLIISGNLISGNEATFGPFANGGGIYCDYGSYPMLSDNIIANNAAYSGGGLYCHYNSYPIISDNVVFDNVANSRGGGIYCAYFSHPVFEVNSIMGNSASDGGGVYVHDADPTFLGGVVKQNTGSSGGGIYFDGDCAPIFDSEQRCSIYLNNALDGRDLFSDSVIEVVVDTFTVMYPTDIHATPLSNFTFDILHGHLDQVNADLFVSPNGDDANSGLTEDEPLLTISMAMSIILADSLNPHTIYLAPGTYSPETNGEFFPIAPVSYVTLQGSGQNETILDADMGSSVVRIDNKHDVIFRDLAVTNGARGFSIANSNTSFENVVIANNSNDEYGFGGAGISCIHASLILLSTFIINNSAGGSTEGKGGGIFCYNSMLSMFNTSIANNSARQGGGMYCEGSQITFDADERCNIYLNQAEVGRDLYSDQPMTVIVDTFTVMTPTGIHASPIENFSFDILHSVLAQVNADLYVSPNGDNANSGLTPDEPLSTIYQATSIILADELNPHTIFLAEGTYSPETTGEVFPVQIPGYVSLRGSGPDETILDAGGENGVIRVDSASDVRIEAMTITNGNGNYASGGGITCANSDLTVSNCLITNNNNSRGIYCGGSNFTLRNSVVSNNGGFINGGNGGGIYLSESNALLTNSVINNNQAPTAFGGGWGGGIFSNASSIELINNTIAHNTSTNGGGICGDGFVIANSIIWGNSSYAEDQISGSVQVSYSNVQGGWDGEGNIDADPLFVDPDNGDFNLQFGSPCIDAGHPAAQYHDGCLPPGLGTLVNDMGAYGGPGNCGGALDSFGTITGFVNLTETDDNSGVRISIANPLGIPNSTFTNSSGYYELLIQPGEYTIAAQKPGYQYGFAYDLTVVQGSLTDNINFELDLSGLPPTNLFAQSGLGDRISLSWEAPSPTPDYYRVYRSHQPGTLLAVLADSVINGQYDDLDVAFDQTYYYGVTAYYANPPGESDFSNEVMAMPNLHTIPYFADFESTDGQFVTLIESGDSGFWEWGEPTVGPDNTFSGVNCWATGLDEDYGNNSDLWLISPFFDLSNQTDAYLSFQTWYNIHRVPLNGVDGGQIFISSNCDGNWQLLTPIDGYPVDQVFVFDMQPGFSGESAGWELFQVDLSDYAGQTVRIGFHLLSNWGGNRPGWYIDDFSITETVSIEDEPANLPQCLELSQNYPNPFNPTTTIQFSIPPVGATLASPDGRTRQAASLRVYNITGQLVKTLIDDHIEPGTHEVTWDGTNDDSQPVGSGVYLYRLEAGDTTMNRRMIFLK